MTVILIPLLQIIHLALDLYSWALLIYIIVGLLMNFQVINPTNQFVRLSMSFLGGILEPVLKRIRTFVPFIGPFDLSPLILFLAIYFVQGVLQRLTISLI